MTTWKLADYSNEDEWGGRMRPAYAYCSKCHSYTVHATPFCPYCGEKMEGMDEVNDTLYNINSNSRRAW